MSTERAQQIIEAIRELPRGDRLRIVEQVVHELAEEDSALAPGTIIGLFADLPELVETGQRHGDASPRDRSTEARRS